VATPNLSLSKIGPESAAALQSLFALYLEDMSEWFDIDTNAEGNHFFNASLVWEHGYDAYLAHVDNSLAGFALVGSAAEWLGNAGAHDIDEFFVLRSFRRRGVGQEMATLLWKERPGDWLVRVLEANQPALSFWQAAISTYSSGTYKEDVHIVARRRWRFFQFVSPGS
jgi:predicted acetyltransferase